MGRGARSEPMAGLTDVSSSRGGRFVEDLGPPENGARAARVVTRGGNGTATRLSSPIGLDRAACQGQSARLRIAVVAMPWWPVPPRAYGSCPASIDALARGLHSLGHHVTLFAPNDSTCPVPRYELGFPSRPERAGDTGSEVCYAAEVYAGMGDFDVVHDHTIVGALHARAFPHLKTIVLTNHGAFDTAMTPLLAAISPWVAIVAVSQAHARSTSLPIADSIHHGVDLDHFRMGAGDGGYLLCLTRMDECKGVHIACDIARRAGIELRIAAKADSAREREYFETRVKPLLGRDIHFLGEVGHTDKVALLADAYALVNPIQWPEPFGLSMAEALASGTPVLTFAHGAAPEIVDHGVTGFLCRDVDDMARACAEVGRIDRRVCRDTAERRFSLTTMAERHIALYRRLVEAGGTKSPASASAEVAS